MAENCKLSLQSQPGDDKNKYVDYIESKEEFKHVERLLPQLEVPPPPKHSHYPTPSGWVPPKEPSEACPYHVRRTRFHNWPVYALYKAGGNQHLTQVRRIEGDIWALDKDLKTHLASIIGETVVSHVNEVAMTIYYKGIFVQEIKDWLKDNGF
ncbi:large ribosomal subunit protein mL49-like [Saccoglossus kowalevskii]